MKKYAFYKEDTKEVIQVSLIPENDLGSYSLPYLEYLLPRYDPSNFKYAVVNGDVIETARTDSSYLKQVAKRDRQILVDNIEVTYKGIIYQGDEVSQSRICRVVIGLPDNGSIQWKAKDNSINELTKADLKEILFLAGQKQTEIWFN